MFNFTGIAVGHVYYFLEDVFPNQQNGRKLLKTPRFMLVITMRTPIYIVY